MFSRTLAASVFAVVCLATGPAAVAADLRDGACDDPRYCDRYGNPLPPRTADPYRRKEYPPREPHPDEFGGPESGARPHGRPHYPGHSGYDLPSHCVPRFVIKKKLIHDGWSDFYDLELRSDVAILKARRPNGSFYRVKVDRCTGHVLGTKLLDGAPDAYADSYSDRHRRY
ncbi:MAG: hypothetical protein ACREC6_08860 [Hyphomicrobiaceae bacterium]